MFVIQMHSNGMRELNAYDAKGFPWSAALELIANLSVVVAGCCRCC